MSNGNSPNANQQLSALHFSIVTGDDDVRGGSNVYAKVVILEGNQIVEIGQSLNNGNSWPNGSTNDSDFRLPTIQIKDIDGIRINFSSGSCFLCTEDNWNMNQIVITYKDDNNQDQLFYQNAGNPLWRFTGSTSVWSQPFQWPLSASAAPTAAASVASKQLFFGR
jgi:hypothetical protein